MINNISGFTVCRELAGWLALGSNQLIRHAESGSGGLVVIQMKA
jgi:hypothetical protein